MIVDEYPVTACIDCVLLVANGELPEGDEDLPERILERWPTVAEDDTCDTYGAVRGTLRWDLCDNSRGDHDEFSAAPCECCGTRMAGARHSLIALLVKR